MSEKNSKPGPEEERLSLDGDWEEKVRKALSKPKPESKPKNDDDPGDEPGPKDD